MKNLKLQRRNIILRNFILYLCLSVVYYLLIKSLTKGVSILDWDYQWSLIKADYKLVSLFVVSFYLSVKGKKASLLFSGIFFTYVFYTSIRPFFVEFDKIILFFNFFYIVFSFYFILFLKEEFNSSYYWPNFSKRNIKKGPSFDVLSYIVRGTDKKEVFLRNWDRTSCFLVFKDNPIPLHGKIVVEFQYEGLTFRQVGHVMTRTGFGLGISFGEKPLRSGSEDWSDFIKIVSDRGLVPVFTI
ncbi:hypothetical protein HON22_05310 [Candidatus Peregrinibacteria bacterium]|nr:hypothetical protein [Candidatus Peregrinibacteria bacterium]